jgi:hypothetical protein
MGFDSIPKKSQPKRAVQPRADKSLARAPGAKKERKPASRSQHLASHLGQVIADRLGRRERVAGGERDGDFAVFVLVALPERRVGVTLFDLQPGPFVTNADDDVVDADGETNMRRRGQIAMEGAIPMLPLLAAAGAIATFDGLHDALQIVFTGVQDDRLGEARLQRQPEFQELGGAP